MVMPKEALIQEVITFDHSASHNIHRAKLAPLEPMINLTLMTNGVSEDAFKLKLFPFSLGDKAHQWEKTLPSDTVATWEECKRAFLDKFFSTSRTAKIRNEISGFQQKGLESCSKAWERFKSYWSQCPHHGFSKESFLSTFYRGALPQCINRLDTASNGFFLGRTEEEAEELVENIAKSESVYSEEHDRVNISDDQQTKKEIKSLLEKMDLLLSNQARQEQMNFVGGPIQEVPPKINEYNNYQQRSYSNNQQGGYQQKQNTQQESYQPRQNTPSGFNNNNNQSTQAQGSSSQAPASDTSVDALFKKPLDFQAKNEKTIGRQQGALPGKPEKNPKETMKAITLQSGKQLSPRILTKDGEKQGGEVAINIDDEVVIVDEKVDEEILEKIVEAKGKGKVGEEKRTVKHGETATPIKESSFVPPPYEPKLPFPGRFKRQLLENKFLKDDVAAKKKEMEGMMILTHECSAIIQRLDVPRKLVDPGCFTLPCALGPMVFERCMCDLGASVSLMPLSIAKKLEFTQYKKWNILHFDINEVMKKPTIQNQVFYIDEMDALADELLEELALEDSLQHALTIEREVQVIENKESDAYVKMLDSHKGISGEGQNEELTYEAHHASSATQQVNLQEDDWSELKAPKVELKPLPQERGIEVDKAKIEVMIGLSPPKTVKDIRSFLGHAGFYRRFIQDFSMIARPMTKLLCKEAAFNFD
ncbi:uncharacterized protein LOC125582242 [Brassica napus]|uniref:uncharacterized protein LOC125582242 n=1 Tax=Brassica napus TaxID=3708 RepID=UPI002078F905|nr:uncharacterized protein LOC125582242 [Brassica napus]